MARTRIKEAKVLLETGYFDGAYYLAGYAVECALKACIAKQSLRYEFPDKTRVLDSYTHDFAKLLRAPNLTTELQKEIKTNGVFRNKWQIVERWSEEARYQTVTSQAAMALYSAIADRQNGVLSWLKKYW
ncbi:MAG: HEPN domain-containing protein [candidate division KSB1 bacterium]|nr:HEPN domain-containing protein [candidate division KSB1 bacterium]MDZ7369500.1 HEPN domain-containing protein [candidate division KSB1 bacterium]MDZ7407597.1 HEPN domain-containing protein [candidate division KSB1 bacterium]